MVRYSFLLYDSCIHYSTPVYPDAIQVANPPHKKSQVAREEMNGLGYKIYAPVREMRIPSFCMRDCSVDRFIPSSVAAPLGPAMVQLA
jgi:hypothetical protein